MDHRILEKFLMSLVVITTLTSAMSLERRGRHIGTGAASSHLSQWTNSSRHKDSERKGAPESVRRSPQLPDEMSTQRDKDDTLWDDGILLSSAGNGKERKSTGDDDDEKKSLSQQVKEGKYGLIQSELYSKEPKRPGIISYLPNSEVPKDTVKNLGGLDKDEIWMAENHILVLRGGNFPKETENQDSTQWPPIDDYEAPRRQVKIPKDPKVPPPFPIQLADGGSIQIIGNNGTGSQDNGTMDYEYLSASRGFLPGEGPFFSIPSGDPLPVPVNNSRQDSRVSEKGRSDPPDFAGPFFPALPPGAVFVPPPSNMSDYDEDDQSIFYPPPYSFVFPQDNTTAIPPGPLVPGIILPPPPDFFSPLDEKKKSKPSRPTTTPPSKTRPYFTSRKTGTKLYKTTTATTQAPIKIGTLPSKPVGKIKLKNVTDKPYFLEITTPATTPRTEILKPALENSIDTSTEKNQWGSVHSKSVPLTAYYATTISSIDQPVEATPASIKTILTTKHSGRIPSKASYYFYEEATEEPSTVNPYYRTTIAPILKGQFKTGTVPQLKTETIPQLKTGTVPQFKTGTLPQFKAKTQFKTETRPQFKSETLPQFKTETLPQFKTETLPQFKTEAVSQFKSETLPQFKTETIPQFKSETLPQFKTVTPPEQDRKKYYKFEMIPSRQTSKDISVKLIDSIVKDPQVFQYTEAEDVREKQENLSPEGPRMLTDPGSIFYETVPGRSLSLDSYYTTPKPKSYYREKTTEKPKEDRKPKPIYQYSFEAAGYYKPNKQKELSSFNEFQDIQAVSDQYDYDGTDAEQQIRTERISPDRSPLERIPSDRSPTDRIPFNSPLEEDRSPSDGISYDTNPLERIPLERIPLERIPSERIPSERIPSERSPSERIPSTQSDRIPLDRNPPERMSPERIPLERIPPERIPSSRIPYKTQSFYQTTVSPFSDSTMDPHQAYFTKQDEQLLDDVTKEYFTAFGKKLTNRAQSTTPIYGKSSTVTEKPKYNTYVPNHFDFRQLKVKVHYGDQSQGPFSLKSDTLVNYKQPLPSINPESEQVMSALLSSEEKPVSLKNDILVNYRNPLPPINPDSEFINVNSPVNQEFQDFIPVENQVRGYRPQGIRAQPSYAPMRNYGSQRIQKIRGQSEFLPITNWNKYPRPVSLQGDTDVNYRNPRPTINPDAEFIQPVQNSDAVKANSYIAYSLPGDVGHVYFLTPQANPPRQEDRENNAYGKPRTSRFLRRRRGPGSNV